MIDFERFGVNSWFVEYLFEEFNNGGGNIPPQWQEVFRNNNIPDNINTIKAPESINKSVFASAHENDNEITPIVGSASKILENMTNSLEIPVATSQRSIPVKLLEENRTIINRYLTKNNLGKVSFTHIISRAIVKSIFKNRALNNSFTIANGKPGLVRKKDINLGIAIDIEKKDGSRSLIVPNIKNSNKLNFKEFWEAYDGLIKRARKGQIDPQEFLGTTITLTNPGTLGTLFSVPRLMSGQGAIIAVGAIQYPAEYEAMSVSTISTLGISKVMSITNTYDHRIIQGAESGLFLKSIHDLLLGMDNFYEEIFEDLSIPLKPVTWSSDYQPGGFENNFNIDEFEKQARVIQLINLYRVRGHLTSNIDPLGSKAQYHPELDPATFKFTIWDLDRTFITGGFGGLRTSTLRQILEILQKTYCEKIGAEYMHIQNPEEKAWLQRKMEPQRNSPDFSDEIKINILNKLITAETLEHFIHNKFIGHKRFSLEGSETLIPVLDYLLNEAAEDGLDDIALGMSHRGRINVLANIIGKSLESIFSEFEDITDADSIEGSGDVKYHLGATGRYKTRDNKEINVSVPSNPSHLEWVNPVTEGITRAKQTRRFDKAGKYVMAVLIHGDAAFAGQGVVAETLNLSQLKGYRTRGTIHIIVNNQIGFTTTPEDARSSVYATDAAKMVQAPIFHVNGDDPEASLWVTKIALEYRQKFNKDVVIDMLGYRRHGHNEGDEPGFTQPLLYEKIKTHPPVTKLYSEKLTAEKILTADDIEKMREQANQKLNAALEKVKKRHVSFKADLPLAVSKEKIAQNKNGERTNISKETLNNIINGLSSLPEGFTPHPKLKTFLEKRAAFINSGEADWAYAEALAFGSILLENTPIRLSGQDSVRGTFSQRHIALTDITSGAERVPLNFISKDQAQIEALDSLLSEAAVLGFEYGYSLSDPLALVIWEAQFGDFANGAQVIIDNFITVSNEKWKTPNNLTLLLPHGFEGQGPEHSSARLERFLTLCAQGNMEVCNITAPAQYFHVLRRQVRKQFKRPLVIMSPKSLLRLPEAKSAKSDFINGAFNEVIDDESVNKNSVNRLVFTSGKLYYELKKFRNANKIENTALIRIEQLYPFPHETLSEILHSYANKAKIVWAQEEPQNMGAWNFISARLKNLLNAKLDFIYSGRPESASPAVGSHKLSNEQQEELIKGAFYLE